MTKRIGLMTSLVLLSSPFAQAAGPYTVVSSNTDPAIVSPLVKTDVLIQDGADSRNRFVMHRVVKASGSPHKGTILLLPSLLSNFHEYMINENQNRMASFAATLAAANYDVWGYSPRVSQIPQGGSTNGSFNCSIVANWGFATSLSDIEYIRAQIAAAHPGENPAIGGLSMGGILGTAVINAHPTEYSGLLLWESAIYSTNPIITTLNAGNCAADLAQIAAGLPANFAVPAAAILSVNVGELAAVQLFGTPNPLFGTPTFITDVPNLLHTQFLYTSFPRIKEMVLYGGNFVESVAILRDYHCSMAGDRTFSSNLSSFVGPIFAIKGGQSLGPYMQDTINLFGSSSIPGQVTSQYNAQFGHADAYLSASHATYAENPILNWLNTAVFP